MAFLDILAGKARKSDSKIWRWVLGVLIGVGVFFLAWIVRRQTSKIARLEAEKKLIEERTKDLRVEAENEKDANFAEALKTEAEQLRAQAAEIDSQLGSAKKKIAEAKARLESAKNWNELEKEADGM